jgi:hypothetical protein
MEAVLLRMVQFSSLWRHPQRDQEILIIGFILPRNPETLKKNKDPSSNLRRGTRSQGVPFTAKKYRVYGISFSRWAFIIVIKHLPANAESVLRASSLPGNLIYTSHGDHPSGSLF